MVRYESARFCPVTHKRLSRDDEFYSRGVCPHCGDIDGSTITHSVTKVRKVEYAVAWHGLWTYRKSVGEWV